MITKEEIRNLILECVSDTPRESNSLYQSAINAALGPDFHRDFTRELWKLLDEQLIVLNEHRMIVKK